MRPLTVAAAICGLLLVAAGATGAHMIPIENRGGWDGAILYGFIHTLAAVMAAFSPFRGEIRIAAGWSFIAGVVLFSGIQIVRLMAPGSLGFAGPLVPVGGIAFMIGWVLIGASAVLSRRYD
jgi:uncharacterized membrane protein YgdD (TMEM256/DUF423 family)